VVVAHDRIPSDHSSLLGQEWPRLWATPYNIAAGQIIIRSRCLLLIKNIFDCYNVRPLDCDASVFSKLFKTHQDFKRTYDTQ
jgi:hypothetical protein